MTHCGLGICAAMDGHEGTCDEASGWVDSGRPFVWHHSCTLHGSSDGPCDPPCDDPWRVDLPLGEWGAGFPTLADAVDFAHAWATYYPHADRMARGER